MLHIIAAVFSVIFGAWIISPPFYWRRKGVQSLTPWPFFGNAFNVLRYNTHDFLDALYYKYPNERMFGFYLFSRPVLMVRDPALAEAVLMKKADHFADKGYTPGPREALCDSISESRGGEKWEFLHLRLSPYFSKDLAEETILCTHYCLTNFMKRLNQKISFGGAINVLDLCTRFTVDLFMVTILGIDTDVHRRLDSQFVQMRKEMLGQFFKFKFYLSLISPGLYSLLRCSLVPNFMLRYIRRMIGLVLDHRNKNPTKKNDFLQGMDTLIKSEQKKESGVETFSDGSPYPACNVKFIASQILSLYPGGTEVLGTVLSMCLYEIARSNSLQDRVKNEIYRYINDNGPQLDFNSLGKLKFLRSVVDEVLRMYNPYVALFRECTKPYRVPGTDFTVEKGTLVCIPVYSLHHDDRFFTNPLVFDPDRFSEECVSGAYIPFGMGPRKCLGKHFALAEIMTSLFHLMTRYRFQVHHKYKLKLSTSRFFLQPDSEVDLVIFPLIYTEQEELKKVAKKEYGCKES